MRVPPFALEQPAIAEIPLVTQDRRIPIDPILVERRSGLVRILFKLCNGQPAGIIAVKATRVKLQVQELMFVRSPTGRRPSAR